MSSAFQGLTDDDGVVQTTATIPPANEIVYFRGFATHEGKVVVTSWDGIAPVVWNGSIAMSPEGYVYVLADTYPGGKRMPGGMYCDENGIVHASNDGVSDVIHQGVGLDNYYEPGQEAGLLEILEGGAASVSIRYVSGGSCTYEQPATDCQAQGIYEAFPALFGGTVTYLWTLEDDAGGLATIVGPNNQKQVTVETDSSQDVTFTLKVVADDTIDNASSMKEFTQFHTEIIVVPDAPTNLVATANLISGAIDVTWDDNSDNETGFRLERAVLSGGPWNPLVYLPPNTVAYSDFSGNPGQTYFYRVFAYNTAGDSDPSNFDSATKPALVNVRITDNGDTRVTDTGDRRIING